MLRQDNQCLNCASGTYYDSKANSCFRCQRFCLSCNGPTIDDCIQCIEGYSRSYNDQQQAISGITVSQDNCVQCQDTNCARCSNYDDCDQCFKGYWYNYDSSGCDPCPLANCAICEQGKTCTECQQGFIFSEKGCVGCNKGYYEDEVEGTCKDCDKKCSSCQNYDFCLECSDGYYMSIVGEEKESGICRKCDSTCISCQFYSDFCLLCKSGYAFEGGCQLSCPQSTYPTDSQTCQKCPDNCLSCDSSNKCTQCTDYNLFDLNEGICQRKCPSGQYEHYAKLIEAVNKTVTYTGEVSLLKDFIEQLTETTHIYTVNNVFFGDRSCISCHSPCSECLWFEDNCMKCIGTLVRNPRTLSCQDKCDQDQYSIIDSSGQAICVQCIHPCIECTYNSCSACQTPFEAIDGTCKIQGTYLEEGECKPSELRLSNLCVNQCPNGMMANKDSRRCQCHPSCKECQWNPLTSEVRCLACMRKESIRYLDKCVETCDLYISEGECVNTCPPGSLITWNKMFTCMNQCAQDQQKIGNYCIQNLCGNGFRPDWNKASNNLYAVDLSQLQSVFADFDNKICERCPRNCGSCDQTTCFACITASYELAAGRCTLRCPEWQMAVAGPSEDNCIDCVAQCTKCNPYKGFALFEGECLTQCPQSTTNNNGVCQLGYEETLFFSGQGNFMRMSAAHPIEVIWKIDLGEDGIAIINSLECLTKQNSTIVSRKEFIRDKLVTGTATGGSFNKSQSFKEEFFSPGVEVTTQCTSNITFLLKESELTQVSTTSVTITTIPLPKGTIRLTQIDSQNLQLFLDGFGPLGLTKSQLQYLMDQYENGYEDNNMYFNEDVACNIIEFLALEVTLWADSQRDPDAEVRCIDYQQPLFQIVNPEQFDSATSLISLSALKNGTRISSFELAVANYWIEQSFTIKLPLIVGVVRPDSALDQLKSATTGKQMNTALNQLAWVVLKASETKNCTFGKKIGNNCDCDRNYVGEKCNLEITSTVLDAKKIFKSLISLISKRENQINTDSLLFISQILLYYSQLPGLYDSYLMSQQADLIILINKLSGLIVEDVVLNLLNATAFTIDRHEASLPQNEYRILESGPIVSTATDTKLNQALQGSLTNAHRTLIDDKNLYRKLTFLNIETILTIVNKTQEEQLVTLNDTRLWVYNEEIQRIIKGTDRPPALFFTRYPLMKWRIGNKVIPDSQYIYQINITTPDYNHQLENHGKEAIIRLEFPDQQVSCLHFNKGSWKWMEKIETQSSLDCESNELGMFSQGIIPLEPHPPPRDNEYLGVINMALCLILHLFLYQLAKCTCYYNPNVVEIMIDQEKGCELQVQNGVDQNEEFEDKQDKNKEEQKVQLRTGDARSNIRSSSQINPQLSGQTINTYHGRDQATPGVPNQQKYICIQDWVFYWKSSPSRPNAYQRSELIILWLTSEQLMFSLLMLIKETRQKALVPFIICIVILIFAPILQLCYGWAIAKFSRNSKYFTRSVLIFLLIVIQLVLILVVYNADYMALVLATVGIVFGDLGVLGFLFQIARQMLGFWKSYQSTRLME